MSRGALWRVVTIHDINAGAQILSLGGPLVGMASREGNFRTDVARYFDLEGIVDVGSVYEPNLERILELQPDLIINRGFDGQVFLLDNEMLATLQSITPVVVIGAFQPVKEVRANYHELLSEAAMISLEDQQLVIRVQAESDENCGRVKYVVSDHLERLSGDKRRQIVWMELHSEDLWLKRSVCKISTCSITSSGNVSVATLRDSWL
ncbi:MAG: DUF2218 domain-containing protein [Chloroflexota bacterium]